MKKEANFFEYSKGDDKGDEGKSRGEKAPKFIPEAELKEKGEPLSLGAGGPAQNVIIYLRFKIVQLYTMNLIKLR